MAKTRTGNVTYKWGPSDRLLWVELKSAPPNTGSLMPGATGDYVYAMRLLSMRVRRVYVDARHTVDQYSVLRFADGVKSKFRENLAVFHRDFKLFREKMTRGTDPVVSDVCM